MAKNSPLESGHYLERKDLFFDSSKLLFSQVTAAFDFMWPAVAGMWNLRQQVNGYLDTNPSASNDELRAIFAKGIGGKSADLKRVCHDFAWDKQQQQFAVFLLINSFTFYESWVANTLLSLDYNPEKYKGEKTEYKKKKKEFSDLESGLQNKQIYSTISKIINPSSSVMIDLFYKTYSSNSKNCIKLLDNLMLCYRYFKEIRNCIMHAGSNADDRLIDEYEEYSLLTAADLNSKELPIGCIPVRGEAIIIGMREVVGFYDIILKIVATVDAELSTSEKALKILIQKIRDLNSRSITLKADKSNRIRQIKSLFDKINMPTPFDYSVSEQFLKENSLVA